MQAPVDYPLIDHAQSAQFSVDELTYATLLDRTVTFVTEPDEPVIYAPVRRLESPATAQPALKPLAVIAQTLRRRDGDASTAARNSVSDISGMISRLSRALR